MPNNSRSVLLCDSANSLHSSLYRQALNNFFSKHNLNVIAFDHYLNSSTPFSDVINAAIDFGVCAVIFVTLDEVLSLRNVKDLIRSNKANNPKIPIFAFYFNLSVFVKPRIKSFFVLSILSLSPISAIIVSIPNALSRLNRIFLKRTKLYYAPDFFLDSEKPFDINEDYLTKFKHDQGLPSSYTLLSYIGGISERKSFNKLLELVSLNIKFLQQNRICIYIAGPLRSSKANLPLIKELVAIGCLVYNPNYLNSREFFCAISVSSLIWCVQKDFLGSSGIFTRACAWGAVPIVSPSSLLAHYVRSYNLGFILDPSACSAQDEFVSIMTAALQPSRLSEIRSSCKSFSLSRNQNSLYKSFNCIFSSIIA